MPTISATQLKSHNVLADAIADVTERYHKANPKSHKNWQNAKNYMPGGNTRTVLHYEPFPLTIVRGEGTQLHDIDGHYYTDFLGEYSANLYGHSNPKIQSILREVIADGITLGAPNQWEAQLAEIICSRIPSIDLVRFTNSGTEANLMALSAARAFTKRNKIMVMQGAYHGGVLCFTHKQAPINVPFDYVYAFFNDIEKTMGMIEHNKHDLAAIIVEPMMGAGGCIPAKKQFLAALRDAADRHGIILIFDEVMTSRSDTGGLQSLLEITPDMTTLGKFVGGGSSFGAFGGQYDIMAQFDPTSNSAFPHAGTFNNNVLSMAAGYIGLSKIFTYPIAKDLFLRGEALIKELNDIAEEEGVEVQVTGCGSIMNIHMLPQKPHTPTYASHPSCERAVLVHLEMQLSGLTYAQRGFISLNLAMAENDLKNFTITFQKVLRKYSGLLKN